MIKEEFIQLQKEENWNFFKKHRTEDPKTFALKYSNQKKLAIRVIAEQIQNYQKAKKKIPSLAKKELIFPAISIEQASSEESAKFKANYITGKKIVDISGGLGVDSIFFSDTFETVYHIEKNELIQNIASHNFKKIKKNNIFSKNLDGLEFIKSSKEKFDWIFVDPSRRKSEKRVFSLSDSEPNVIENQKLFLSKAKNVMIKASPALDFSVVKREFETLNEFIAISVDGECKEVLLVLGQKKSEQIEIKSITINSKKNNVEIFQKREKTFYQKAVSSHVLKYFYEPDCAIIKAGLSAKVAYSHGIAFVNSQAVYMTSDKKIDNFTGRRFIVKDIIPYQKKTLKNFLKLNKITKANVARRHFPDSPEYIKKIFKLGDGGKDYLFFTHLENNTRVCIHAERIENVS